LSLLQNSNAISSGGYNLESSLRFRRSANAYLSRTPDTAGNRKTFTFSLWFKGKGYYTGNDHLIGINTSSTSYARIYYGAGGDNYLKVNQYVGGVNLDLVTTQVLRDPSAWYHLVVAFDTTQATASNRIKVYLNGEQITSFSTATYPSQNFDTLFNTTNEHRIGTLGATYNTGYEFDGYMTEINFVDGQALTPSDFGETDGATGVWKPKEYTGTYGTNGFYLPMKETQQATGFNTVLYDGTSATQSITGVGFSPDLVWVKSRTSANNNVLSDSVRGATKFLVSNASDAEVTNANYLTSFDSDGFTFGNASTPNGSGRSYVAWCWDAGSSTVSNTDGTITSTVRANPATGFSIVSYVGTGTTSTIGHGLSSAPDMIITKNRDIVDGWFTYHSSLGSDQYMNFWTTAAVGTTLADYWGPNEPTSSVFGIGTWGGNNTNGNNYIAYCFSEVAGYSKFGSYTGTGSSGNSVTGLGFRPAFLMIKRTDSTGSWVMYDNTREVTNDRDYALFANLNNAETYQSNGAISFDADGFTLNNTGSSLNASGTYIYMAFADTRDAQFNFDASGNKNNWTANNINSNASSETTYDIMNDVPTLTDEDTANFCTLNPLSKLDLELPYTAFSDGNLSVDYTNAAYINNNVYGSIAVPNSGKWYYEARLDAYYGSSSLRYGFDAPTITVSAAGDYAIAVDYDNGLYWTRTNGTWTGDPEAGTGGTSFSTSLTSIRPYVRDNSGSTGNGGIWIVNFGQRPFKYSQPTGFKKINTYNLPDSTIKDGSQYFITNTFTGTGSTLSIDTGFSPDFVWLKSRSFADHPLIYDSIRGANQRLYSSLTNAESTATNQLNSFDSDGYTLGSDPSGQINVSGQTSVGWSWRASDSTPVSNTAGSITSTVSANSTAGFAIATYTGTGNVDTVGHGLTVQPDFIMVKDRSAAQSWICYTKVIDGSNDALFLDTTAAAGDSGFSGATSTVFDFSVGASSYSNTAGRNYVMYSFASVEGFSKIGTYTGNGSADGPFVYTGFRPAFVLTKSATEARNWVIIDTARDPYNLADQNLEPNTSNAEFTNADDLDILSNGFKPRTANPGANGNGQTIIYMAFAENPFKYSLAR
jgi:hypothetical protein